jgi:phage gpG-like protein
VSVNFRFFDESSKVAAQARRASYELVEKAAFRIYKSSKDSIQKAPLVSGVTAKKKRDSSGRFLKGSGKKGRKRTVPSAPGSPPHTRRNQLKNAIVYYAKRGEATIGPRASRVGTSATAHEFGGQYKDESFPARPFMGPALDRDVPLFGNSFAGSIGS